LTDPQCGLSLTHSKLCSRNDAFDVWLGLGVAPPWRVAQCWTCDSHIRDFIVSISGVLVLAAGVSLGPSQDSTPLRFCPEPMTGDSEWRVTPLCPNAVGGLLALMTSKSSCGPCLPSSTPGSGVGAGGGVPDIVVALVSASRLSICETRATTQAVLRRESWAVWRGADSRLRRCPQEGGSD